MTTYTIKLTVTVEVDDDLGANHVEDILAAAAWDQTDSEGFHVTGVSTYTAEIK
jgi:hypothetical protein